MKITIDTRDDKHEIKHLLNMLRAIAEENPRANFNTSSSGNIFDDPSPSVGTSDPYSYSEPTPEPSSLSEQGGLFNMFDSSAPSNPIEEKKGEKKGDFLDTLQPY